jgi:hypothetical protein
MDVEKGPIMALLPGEDKSGLLGVALICGPEYNQIKRSMWEES